MFFSDAMKLTFLGAWLYIEVGLILCYGILGWNCYVERLLEPWFFGNLNEIQNEA